MPQFDLLIKNGCIISDTGDERFVGNIGITNGVISHIGDVTEMDGKEVIDAEGLIVASGVAGKSPSHVWEILPL